MKLDEWGEGCKRDPTPVGFLYNQMYRKLLIYVSLTALGLNNKIRGYMSINGIYLMSHDIT